MLNTNFINQLKLFKMRRTIYLLFAMVVFAAACNSNSDETENIENTEVISNQEEEKIEELEKIAEELETNGNNNLSDEIIGKWVFNHEPDCMIFKADGSFETGMPIEDGKIEVFGKGKWSLSDNILTIKYDDGRAEENPVSIDSGILFIGETPTEEYAKAEGFDSINEYMEEYGYSKKK